MFSRAKSRAIILLAALGLASQSMAAPMSRASPTYQEEETLQPLHYDYSGLKGVTEEVMMEVSEKILVIKTEISSVFKEEEEKTEEQIEDVSSEVVEEKDASNSEEEEDNDIKVAKGGAQVLTDADQVAVQMEVLLEGLAEKGEHITMWRRSRGLEGGGGGGWHRVAVRENSHGTLISKGW